MSEKEIEAQFVFKTLPKINGEPDFKQLKELKDKLKANASKIQSDLMGGNHGHLGICLTPAEQALVSPIPYVRPGNPGPLTIPHGATARQENGLREDHKRARHLFHEVNVLDTSLKKTFLPTPLTLSTSRNYKTPSQKHILMTFQRF